MIGTSAPRVARRGDAGHAAGPPAGSSTRPGAVAVLAGLVLSATALATAPVLMPDTYSWVSMTTSESAAQGVHGAWLARLGFLVVGLSVNLLSSVRTRSWGPWASGLHTCFGVLMIAAAAFSTRPWGADAQFDRIEDALHSVAATAMGFAFAAGVLATMFHAHRHGAARSPLFDIAAIGASVVVPLAMSVWPDIEGALQRVMFAVAYGWYAAEAGRSIRP